MYLDSEWGTFCANGFNSHVADAACRHHGSISDDVSKASDYVDVIPLASNSTPIHTGTSRCGKTDVGGFSHVLGCFDLDIYVGPTCTHDDDVIIDCFSLTLNLNA